MASSPRILVLVRPLDSANTQYLSSTNSTIPPLYSSVLCNLLVGMLDQKNEWLPACRKIKWWIMALENGLKLYFRFSDLWMFDLSKFIWLFVFVWIQLNTHSTVTVLLLFQIDIYCIITLMLFSALRSISSILSWSGSSKDVQFIGKSFTC